MPTRNVVLTEHQETLIETLVQSGRYQNASEVMREGSRKLQSLKLSALPRNLACPPWIAASSKNSRTA
jgi:putative addiction module CopG family antidote